MKKTKGPDGEKRRKNGDRIGKRKEGKKDSGRKGKERTGQRGKK